MDKSAIEHIQNTAAAVALATVATKQVNDSGAPVALVPSDFKELNLEKYLVSRVRFRAQFATSHINSFAHYHEQHGDDATVFIDKTKMLAKAIFNLGNRISAGHGDHTATLLLEKTAAYRALEKISNERTEQRQLAEWIEDWRANITATNSDDQPIQTLALASTIRNVDIETARSLNSTAGDWSGSRSAMESVEIKSKAGSLPKTITFTCPAYHGLPEQKFVFRISINTSEKLTFTVTRAQAEADAEQTADLFADVLKNHLSANTKILQGTITL